MGLAGNFLDCVTLKKLQRKCAEICCLDFYLLQLFWARVVLRKWLNIATKDSDYSADTDDEEEIGSSSDEEG